jgi:hypothetical protein
MTPGISLSGLIHLKISNFWKELNLSLSIKGKGILCGSEES